MWEKNNEQCQAHGVCLRMLSAIVSHRICQSKVTWGEKQFNLLIKKFRFFFALMKHILCMVLGLILLFSRSFLDDICYAHSVSTCTHQASIKRAEIRYHYTDKPLNHSSVPSVFFVWFFFLSLSLSIFIFSVCRPKLVCLMEKKDPYHFR